jgi:hypothetical protein
VARLPIAKVRIIFKLHLPEFGEQQTHPALALK